MASALESLKKIGKKNKQLHFMKLFSAVTIMFFKKKSNIFFDPENMKEPPSKVAHNRPRAFFSVLPLGPNPSQISIPVP